MFARTESQPQPQRRNSSSSVTLHKASIDRHQLSEMLTSFLTHMFAPASCQQCLSTSPYSLTNTTVIDRKCDCVVNGEYVLFDGEQDGGPLCREATIESWKMTSQRKRRFSVHCFSDS
ncbi:hypothetical protein EK21DRAFT_86502 [Setomelanomma holmii]|uniref:Uncharacterized protein n=1 Tax=Setomelanomma holmii TaxID=210430 RepID=A0A9P4LQT0_9PLEO|nr:hypothetical protein EK21DRAFT_86502 [Setomelanomma holmii]